MRVTDYILEKGGEGSLERKGGRKVRRKEEGERG